MIGYTKIFTWEINSNVQGKIHLFRTNLYNILQNIINLCQFHWKLTMMTTACLIIWTLLIVLNTKFTFQVEDPSDLLRTSLYFFKWVTAFSFLINFRGQPPLISFYFILQISNLFQMIQILYCIRQITDGKVSEVSESNWIRDTAFFLLSENTHRSHILHRVTLWVCQHCSMAIDCKHVACDQSYK